MFAGFGAIVLVLCLNKVIATKMKVTTDRYDETSEFNCPLLFDSPHEHVLYSSGLIVVAFSLMTAKDSRMKDISEVRQLMPPPCAHTHSHH
jgi:hypothetical protein